MRLNLDIIGLYACCSAHDAHRGTGMAQNTSGPPSQRAADPRPPGEPGGHPLAMAIVRTSEFFQSHPSPLAFSCAGLAGLPVPVWLGSTPICGGYRYAKAMLRGLPVRLRSHCATAYHRSQEPAVPRETFVPHRIAMPIHDLTGNRQRRPPLCPVTRAMADAGRAKLDTLTAVDEDAGVTDDQLVSEIFTVMWAVYWEQVFALQGKNVKTPFLVEAIPQAGLIRN